ncbi:GNAT family N-acetyltransferase [Anaerosporobacter faecicola]|uniref:GNAT family N-acetyltransferase n=1 Tax=Anaerosporobacter faecicola TaxID=2718714 RepID=UPI00143A56A2|nr:GNAT family N-acetyltransferase [Anaerosporobacter faecicola]
MKLEYGQTNDIVSWMELVDQISGNFPGLETKEEREEHKKTVLRFISRREAICIKEKGKVVGVLLFSKKHNRICCMAVSQEYRKKGIATMLMEEAIKNLDRDKRIMVTTFREGDEKGIAARAFYKKFGFVEGRFVEEFGYPNQELILDTDTVDNKVRVKENIHLFFEPLNEIHTNALARIWSNTEVTRYTNIKEPCTEDETRRRIHRLKEYDTFVVWDEEKNQIVGVVGCPCMNETKGEYGVFYQFDQAVWGKGYASKAVEWLLRTMHEKHGTCLLIADVCIANIASERILKKVGFTLMPDEVQFEKNGVVQKVHQYQLQL